MEEPTYPLPIQLSPALYQLLRSKAQELGKSEQEVLEIALQSWLASESTTTPAALIGLEKRLEELIDRRIAALRAEFFTRTEMKPPPPLPTVVAPVRPLQSGDVVQVRESGSPYYLAELVITRVGIIRAYVSTREGEKSFLKRDLRFLRTQADHE